MANFLESILGSSTNVYISVSSSNWLEMVVLDKHTNLIQSYARTSIEYNEAKREIEDYDIFKRKIAELYKDCDIQPKGTNVYFSLPLVWFGFKDNIPVECDEDNVNNIVMNELDQTYIFKSMEGIPFSFPGPASDDITLKSVFYTAMQAEVLESVRSAFNEIGANLVEFDISLFCYLRALITTGIAESEMDSGTKWGLMIVNNSGFQLYGLEGKNFIDYNEEPIAIKSFEGDEVYSAIDNSVQSALMVMKSAPETLVIISETDLVSAETLSKRLQYNGKLVTIEENKFKKQPFADIAQLLPPDQQLEVSLGILGLFADRTLLPIDLNFLSSMAGYERSDILEIPLGGGKVITLTKPQAMQYSIIALVIVLVLFGSIALGTSITKDKYTSKIEQVEGDLAEVQNQLKQYEGKSGFDEFSEIEKVLKYNRTKVMSYASLGDSIPKNVYLTYYMSGNDGYIDIQGCADSVEDVYIFFQNLKDSLFESKLRLSKLDLKADSLDSVINTASAIDKAPYVFEITNMDESQLSSFMNALRSTDNNANQNQGQEQGQNQNQTQNQPPAQDSTGSSNGNT